MQTMSEMSDNVRTNDQTLSEINNRLETDRSDNQQARDLRHD